MSDPTTIADVLDAAADLIEPEGAWTTETVASTADGNSVLSDNPQAVCFCAMGAIFRCGGDPVGADKFFGGTICPGGGWGHIGPWNDAPERTQAEVVAKLREAAALARARGL